MGYSDDNRKKKIKPSTRRGTGEGEGYKWSLFFRLAPRAFPFFWGKKKKKTRNKRNDSCVALSGCRLTPFWPSCPDGAAGQKHRVALAHALPRHHRLGAVATPWGGRSWTNSLELSTPGSPSQTKDWTKLFRPGWCPGRPTERPCLTSLPNENVSCLGTLGLHSRCVAPAMGTPLSQPRQVGIPASFYLLPGLC